MDDETTLLEICKNYLERTKEFHVTIASSASAGIALLQSEGIQAIVSDYQMPEMDGIEFLKKVRATNKRIPFIIFTGKGREEIAIQAFENGADSYIQKGGEPKSQFADLAQKIRSAVASSQAKTALQENQIKLANAMNLAQIVNWEYDVGSGLFSFDGRFYALYGTTAEREGGNLMPAEVYIREFVHPEDIPYVISVIKDVPSATDPDYSVQLEHRIIRRDGQVRNIVVRFAVIMDEAGRVIRTYGANQDITERKVAEEMLRVSQEKYTKAFQSAPNAITISDLESGQFIEVNDAACNLFGYNRDELIGKSARELAIWLNTESRESLIDQIKNQGSVTGFEIVERRKSGELYTASVTADTITIGNNRYLIAIIIDITERKRVEEALRANEHRLASIYDTAGDVLFHLSVEPDGQYRFSSVNRAFCRVTGLPMEAVVGRTVNEIIPEPSLSLVLEKYRKAIAEKAIVRWEETSDYPAGRLTGDVSVAPIYDNAGNCTHLVGSVHDITEHKRAEKCLALTAGILKILNEMTSREDVIRDILLAVRQSTGIEACAIRLHDSEDYPYYRTDGFPDSFVKAERSLCARDNSGRVLRDADGKVCLECMCGNIICGRTDPAFPFFTRGGSFWTNSTTGLLASTTEKNRQTRTRNRCNAAGYESVALVPLRSNGTTIGLLQMNDHRKDCFSLDLIEFFETLGSSIGIAVNRRKTEEALQVAQQKYLKAFLSAPDAITISEFETGRFVEVNDAACSLFGYTRDELIGKNGVELSIWLNKEDRDSIIDRIRNEGRVVQAEVKQRRKSGELYQASISADTFTIGTTRYLIATTRDITGQKQAEEALRDNKDRLNAIVRGSPIPQFVIDYNHRVIYWNDTLEKYSGIPAGKIIGTNQQWRAFYPRARPCMADVLVDGDLEKISQWYEGKYAKSKLIEGGYEATDFFPHMGQSGTWLHFTAALIRGSDGSVIGAIETLEDITEQKRAEEEIHELNQFQSSVITNANVWLMVLDPKGNIRMWSRAAEEISGYTEQEVKGNYAIWKMLYPDIKYRKKITKNIRRIITENNYLENMETTIRCKNGMEKIILWNTRSLPDDKGTVTGYVAIGVDITKSVKAERALRESEGRLRTLLENIPDYVIVHHKGKILYVNPACETGLGYPQRYLFSHPLLFFIIPEYHEKVIDASRRRLQGEVVEPYEVDVVTANGSRRTVSIRGALVDFAGRPASLNVLTDITEHKNAEEAQRRFAEFQEGIITNARVWLSVLDQKGKIIIWNSAAEEISGYSADEVIGKNEIWKMIYPEKEYRKQVTDTINRIIRDKKYIENFETTIRAKQGDEKVISWNTKGIPDASGKISDYIAIGVDITDRKHAERALRQANRQLNLLSSITRHDILNQLLALKGYLELSTDFIEKPEKLSEFIKKEQLAASTIENQIKFTKDYQELGETPPVWQNVSENIKNAVAGLPMRDVRVEVERTDLEIFSDRLFEKVFYNLIDNALRYGGEQMTTIRVSSQESGGSLVIAFEDDGMGISGEDKKHLFTKGFGRNSGLGLFLVKEILSITGITITENGAPGKGARFEIAVPKGMYRFRDAG